MKPNEQNKINEDMEDVIETSRRVRDFLINMETPIEERKSEIPNLRIVLDANKNIVSASNVKISVEKLSRGK